MMKMKLQNLPKNSWHTPDMQTLKMKHKKKPLKLNLKD